jgi:hypothetical protein
MRVLPALVVLLLVTPAPAQELTVAEVVAAHRAGAPEEGILRLIREAPAVASLGPADVSRLRAAGVPEPVIQALVARTTPTPTAPPVRPDDARLAEVVRTTRSGLSAELVAEEVRRSGHRYTLTVNDLIYLKENGVADAVIFALLATGAIATPVPPTLPPSTTPAPTPMAESAAPRPQPTAMESVTFGPLLRMTGAFRRESTGTLVVTADRLEWRDAHGPEQSAALPVASLRAVWLASRPQGTSGTVSELRIRTTAGDDLTFRDADWANGGSDQVAALYRTLETRFPQAILREKSAR